MQIMYFVAIMVLAYLGTWLSFKMWLARQKPQAILGNLLPGATAFFVGGMMMALAASVTVSTTLTPKIYATLILPLFVILYACLRCPRKKLFIMWAPLICFGGTYALQTVLPNVILTWPDRIMGTLLWLCVMGAVVWFDKLPFVSTLTVTAWALLLGLVCVSIGTIPLALVVLLGICASVLWAIERELSKHREGHLGYSAASVLGFVMGGVIAGSYWCGANGAIVPLLGYYLFEIALFTLTFMNLHPLGMTRGEFAYQAVMTQENGVRVLSMLFKRLLVFSLIGGMVWGTTAFYRLGFILIIVWLDLYNRLRLRGGPLPTCRELLKDTGASIKCFWNRASDAVQTLSNHKKKENAQPKNESKSKRTDSKTKRKRKK